MLFSEQINEYINTLGCTVKDLAATSDLSAATLSRYRNGERTPDINDESITKLAAGIVKVACDMNIDMKLNQEEILTSLKDSIAELSKPYDVFSNRLDALCQALNINMSELSTALNYDKSYLYRLRNGQRKPKELDSLTEQISFYITGKYTSNDDLSSLSTLTNISIDVLADGNQASILLRDWLVDTSTADKPLQMDSFLSKLNDFDLGEYIKSIHFDDLKVPNLPFYITPTKEYYGIESMRNGELDFFKSAVFSKSSRTIFMHNDMPMDDMAEDMDFNRKWMFAIAMSIKKGLNINIIHNIDRPMNELMLGLEAWIPIYMTGQVNPYYLPDYTPDVYHHLTYVSENVALIGECIHGDHTNGHYHISANKKEVDYYHKYSNKLLNLAKPLMEIFTEKNMEDFDKRYGSLLKDCTNQPDFNATFKNISLNIPREDMVVITKEKSPYIRFVITHPIMVDAIKNFTPAV